MVVNESVSIQFPLFTLWLCDATQVHTMSLGFSGTLVLLQSLAMCNSQELILHA